MTVLKVVTLTQVTNMRPTVFIWLKKGYRIDWNQPHSRILIVSNRQGRNRMSGRIIILIRKMLRGNLSINLVVSFSLRLSLVRSRIWIKGRCSRWGVHKSILWIRKSFLGWLVERLRKVWWVGSIRSNLWWLGYHIS